MEYPKVLYNHPDRAGEVFMPSNGTEGMAFTSEFCDNCIHEKWSHTQDHADKACDILSRSIIYWYDSGNPEYPKEWRFSAEGWPVCTAWVKWDWNRDDDGNWNDPPTPEPDDPMQLCMPFEIEGVPLRKEVEQLARQ
jgi:hypothetical protein